MSAQHTPGRRCGFCQTVAVQVEDSSDAKRYFCLDCCATEHVAKGKTSWWYFGWQRAAIVKATAKTEKTTAVDRCAPRCGKCGGGPVRFDYCPHCGSTGSAA